VDILLIDGRDELCSHLAVHLREEGHKVRAILGLEASLAWLKGHCPDVIVVEQDILIRGGRSLLQVVAQHSNPPAIPSSPRQSDELELSEVLEQIERTGRLRQRIEEIVRLPPARLRIGELVIDQAKRRAIFRGQLIHLVGSPAAVCKIYFLCYNL